MKKTDWVRKGKTRHDEARQGKAGYGRVRQSKERQGKARKGEARQGEARQFRVVTKTWNDLKPSATTYNHLQLPQKIQ